MTSSGKPDRWTLVGRISHGIGRMGHVEIVATRGPVIPENETVEVMRVSEHEAWIKELEDSLIWALTWIISEARMPADCGGLPSDQEEFDKADKLVARRLRSTGEGGSDR